MTYPETEFYDCKTLALLYDSDRDVIKKTVHELKDKGHVIEVLYWGKQGKMEMDNNELQAGKSPHSGFTPDCPKAFDGFAKPSRPSRFEESNNQ